jgi:hypothetical protein
VYQAQLEQLTSFATSAPFEPEVMAAKADYFSSTGEVFEDDRSFEARMASFLEHYLFDRVLPDHGETPARLFLRQKGEGLGTDEKAYAQAFGRTHHSIFEVQKLNVQGVRIRDLFTGRDYDVFERRGIAGMSPGDLLEARLIPAKSTQLMFSQAFCYHPRKARRAILREIDRQTRKPAPEYAPRSLIFALSYMALKIERYRNIAVEAIYTFDRKTI